ncbi:hypothetical protein PAPYR_13054 [Paratrimastix pyriformis]|uniref:Right handed beta helix domain-containing protein n=1 Tax=Paratrimastix pyriformis TaxID=342808 RepID=A0ABQ8U0W5_9EUKA|nr:hypothetical protein PAPYR_13054 [Paratrimastix pyriformis]
MSHFARDVMSLLSLQIRYHAHVTLRGVTLTHAHLTGNDGAAIHIEGDEFNYPYPHVVALDCVFESNIAVGTVTYDGWTYDAYGGAVLIDLADLTLVRCEFLRNIGNYGGALAMYYTAEAVVTMIGCLFEDNLAFDASFGFPHSASAQGRGRLRSQGRSWKIRSSYAGLEPAPDDVFSQGTDTHPTRSGDTLAQVSLLLLEASDHRQHPIRAQHGPAQPKHDLAGVAALGVPSAHGQMDTPPINITDSQFVANSAEHGGAIFAESTTDDPAYGDNGPLRINLVRCLLSDNHVWSLNTMTWCCGGAVQGLGSWVAIVLEETTVQTNGALRMGGAFCMRNASALVATRSRILGNRAVPLQNFDWDLGTRSQGGAVYCQNCTLDLQSTLVQGNGEDALTYRQTVSSIECTEGPSDRCQPCGAAGWCWRCAGAAGLVPVICEAGSPYLNTSCEEGVGCVAQAAFTIPRVDSAEELTPANPMSPLLPPLDRPYFVAGPAPVSTRPDDAALPSTLQPAGPADGGALVTLRGWFGLSPGDLTGIWMGDVPCAAIEWVASLAG